MLFFVIYKNYYENPKNSNFTRGWGVISFDDYSIFANFVAP